MSPRPPRRPRSTGPAGPTRHDAEQDPRRPGAREEDSAPRPVRDADRADRARHVGPGVDDARTADGPDREAAEAAEVAGAAVGTERTDGAGGAADVDDTVVPLTRDVPLVGGGRSASGTTPEADRGPDEDAGAGRASSSGSDRDVSGPNDPNGPADPEADLLAFPEPEVVVHRRRRRRGLLLILSGLAALLVVVLVLVFSPLLTVKQVQVEGNDLLGDSRAQELLEPVLGRPMPQVGDGRVEELLAEEAVVADVVVQGELPDTLRVEITEHPPVAEVRRDGRVEYYTAGGEVIRSWPAEEAPAEDAYATPEISSDAALDHRAVFEAIVGVLGELPDAARESMESATAESVDSVRLRLDDGRTVVWGGEDRGEQKAEVLAALLASDAEEFTEVDTIDISDPEAPVTR